MHQPRAKILVAEDEPDLAELVKLRLEWADYEVAIARDGEEAWQKIQGEEPDLVLLDLMMPKLNGYRVCRLARKRFSRRRLPIIMMTVRDSAKEIETGYRMGANDYITKPYEGKVLLDKIGRNLRKTNGT